MKIDGHSGVVLEVLGEAFEGAKNDCWDSGDRVITIPGLGVVGKALSPGEATLILGWLQGVGRELNQRAEKVRER